MSLLFAAFIFALVLIGFAIYKKDDVRASFSFRPFGFFLEAKSNHKNQNEDAQAK